VENSVEVPPKLKIYLSSDLVISLLSIYPEKRKSICMLMFRQHYSQQPRNGVSLCLPTDERNMYVYI
jgi:hypothetical protein